MAKNSVADWSETAASNTDVGGVNIDEGCPAPNVNNAERETMAQIAKWTGDDTIASATTTDLSTVPGMYVDVTGTTTITGLGTVKAGWVKFLKFSGALTLTHNATSLILPGAANITTAAGDTAVMVSEGSGNWRCLDYMVAANVPFSIIDEDDMASDSATRPPSQQSVKAFATLKRATPLTSTSGSDKTFSGLPAGLNIIYMTLTGVSVNSAVAIKMRLGDSGGVESTGYLGAGSFNTSTSAYNDGLGIRTSDAAHLITGTVTAVRHSGNQWVLTALLHDQGGAGFYTSSSRVTLSGELDRVALQVDSSTFDAGEVNVEYGY